METKEKIKMLGFDLLIFSVGFWLVQIFVSNTSLWSVLGYIIFGGIFIIWKAHQYDKETWVKVK